MSGIGLSAQKRKLNSPLSLAHFLKRENATEKNSPEVL